MPDCPIRSSLSETARDIDQFFRSPPHRVFFSPPSTVVLPDPERRNPPREPTSAALGDEWRIVRRFVSISMNTHAHRRRHTVSSFSILLFFFSLHVRTVPVHLELLRRLFPDREQATVLRESPFILSPALRFPVSEALTRCCGETEVPTRVSRLTALTSLPSGLISLHVPLSSELGGSVSWASRGAVVALPPSFCPGACNERRDDFLRS